MSTTPAPRIYPSQPADRAAAWEALRLRTRAATDALRAQGIYVPYSNAELRERREAARAAAR